MKDYICTFFILFLGAFGLIGQALPGNVSGVSLWVNADGGVLDDLGGNVLPGGSITTLVDKVSSTVLTKGGTATLSSVPNLGLNYHPSLSMSNGDFSSSTIGVNDFINPTNGSMFVVVQGSMSIVATVSSNSAATCGQNRCCVGYRGNNVQFNSDASYYSPTPNSAQTNISGFSANIGDPTLLSLNGIHQSTASSFSSRLNEAYTLKIGGFPGYRYTGDIAEVLVYDRQLSLTEMHRIESALALKYAVTLDQSIGAYVNSDNVNIYAEVNHWNDIIALGRDDNACILQKQSKDIDGETVIYLSNLDVYNTLNTGTFSSDKQYLITGHDNASLSFGEIINTPINITARLSRSWSVNNTNFDGTFSMDIVIDTAGTDNLSKLKLLVDIDGDFVNAVEANPTFSYNGSTLTISNIDNSLIPINSVRYLSLGIDDGALPGNVKDVTFWLNADDGLFDSGGGSVLPGNPISSVSDKINNYQLNSSGTTNLSSTSYNTLNYHPSFEMTSGMFISPSIGVNKFITPSVGSMFTVVNGSLGIVTTITSDATNICGGNRCCSGFRGNRVEFNGTDLSYGVLPSVTETNISGFASKVGTPTLLMHNGKHESLSNSLSNRSNENYKLRVGGFPGYRYTGSIAEVLIYDRQLSITEMARVESALALKYGVTLSQDVGTYVNSDDVSVYDNTSYWNDIIALARDDNSCVNQKQSIEKDGETIIYLSTLADLNKENTGLFSSDKQFIVMGHNNNVIEFTETANTPSTIDARLERIWVMKNTSFDGFFSLDILLDTTGTNALTDLRLLQDDNADFDNATVLSASFSYDGTTLTIANIDNTVLPLNSTRFISLGIKNNTVLSENTIRLQARPSDNEVTLSWNVGTLNSSNDFIIERSRNAKEWSEIGSVSLDPKITNYKFKDPSLVEDECYYRIIQIEDNNILSSNIVVVNLAELAIYNIFPNPSSTNFFIKSKADLSRDKVEVYNLLGEQQKIYLEATGNDLYRLELFNIPKGVYWLSIDGQTSKIVKE